MQLHLALSGCVRTNRTEFLPLAQRLSFNYTNHLYFFFFLKQIPI